MTPSAAPRVGARVFTALARHGSSAARAGKHYAANLLAKTAACAACTHPRFWSGTYQRCSTCVCRLQN